MKNNEIVLRQSISFLVIFRIFIQKLLNKKCLYLYRLFSVFFDLFGRTSREHAENITFLFGVSRFLAFIFSEILEDFFLIFENSEQSTYFILFIRIISMHFQCLKTDNSIQFIGFQLSIALKTPGFRFRKYFVINSQNFRF